MKQKKVLVLQWFQQILMYIITFMDRNNCPKVSLRNSVDQKYHQDTTLNWSFFSTFRIFSKCKQKLSENQVKIVKFNVNEIFFKIHFLF